MKRWRDEPTEESFWGAVLAYAGVKFKTYSGLPFSYEIKKGRNGEYTKELQTIGVRPHKEKINISKEIINKTKGAVAPYAAQIFTHLSVVSSRQRSYDWLRCEGKSRG